VRPDSRGVIDLADAFGEMRKKGVGWVVADLTLDRPERLVIHAGADWWMRWLVDGRCVYQTPPGGNIYPVAGRAHPIPLNLDAGRHVLAVRIVAGSGGWALASEAVRQVAPPTTDAEVAVEARCEFTVDRPDDYASFTLEGDPKTLLNGQPVPLPLDGMIYRRVPGISPAMLEAGANVLSRDWTLDPADAAARIGPLRIFQASGPDERIAPDARCHAVPPHAARIVTGPLLSPRNDGGLTVTCRTDAAVAVDLHIAGRRMATSEPGLIHRFDIDAVSIPAGPEYTVVASEAPVSSGRTARLPQPRSADRLRIAIAADAGPLPEVWREVAHAVADTQPDLFVFVGDMVSHGRHDEQWDREFIDPARPLLAASPTLIVPGNHDEDAPLMKKLWPVFNHGRHWTLRVGPALLVGLDGATDFSPASPDADWLDHYLADHPAPFTFVFNHYPAYSSGGHTRRNAQGALVEPPVHAARHLILPILQRHAVTALFSGHDHGYERFEPAEGPTLFITAGAGAYLYDDQQRDDADAPPRAARAKIHHFAFIDLTPHAATLTAVDRHGTRLDQTRWTAPDPPPGAP